MILSYNWDLNITEFSELSGIHLTTSYYIAGNLVWCFLPVAVDLICVVFSKELDVLDLEQLFATL